MTNDLGHQIARSVGDEETLGAYRRGNRISWRPGALIDVWVPCPRGEVATGVLPPHVYFVQTVGEGSAESGSIHCPACRAELAARGNVGPASPLVSSSRALGAQSALPF